MIAVTNPKIANLVPEAAPFPGFSLLFDNPGDCLRPSGATRVLACDVENNPSLGFYRQLRDAMHSLHLRELLQRYLFCPLPPPSYHVTVWDGANNGNYGEATHQCELIVLLDGLPGSLTDDNPFSRLINASPLVTESHEIRFAFAELCNWGNVSLVATLTPADVESSAMLEQIKVERERLISDFAASFRLRTSPHPYHPHVSLGYYANQEAAQGTHEQFRNWNDAFRQQMRDTTIAFRTVSLFGFTDMATFYTMPQVDS